MADEKVKKMQVGAASYTGFSLAGPLNGETDTTQRLRQDVFAGVNLYDFKAQSYTFIQQDWAKNFANPFTYAETNLWLGHSQSPVDFAAQWVFSGSDHNKGFLGVRLNVNEIPGIKSGFEAAGLSLTLQPMMGFDYSTGELLKEVYTEVFYVLDPFNKEWPVRPRLTGFVDIHNGFGENEDNTVNTEQRLEAVIPVSPNMEIVPALEWRRMGYLPGEEADKESLAGIVSFNAHL